jgi:predicted metalloprotease with PDZ domain
MTILGRYGTRSHRTDSSNDVSLEGFAQAMERALELHSPKAKENPALAGKQSEPLSVARPEQYASLKRYTPSLDWEGKVVKSCMHCHMVAEAQRHEFRSAGMDLPERLLFPYPNPKALGLVMDPKSAARVQSVAPGSAAEKGGFQAGDEIRLLHGQAIVSTADIQWVLENAGVTDEIRADVLRGGKPAEPSPKLVLTEGWRAKDDITWRVTSWDLRRMTTGGMVLEAASDAERAKLGIEKGAMALVAKHVGQYGEHAAAKNAGFVKGDVIVAVDGRTDVVTETQWLTWLVNAKKPGDKIAVTMLRDGKKSELSLPIQ